MTRSACVGPFVAMALLAAVTASASASGGVAGRVFAAAGDGTTTTGAWTVATGTGLAPDSVAVGPRGDLVVFDRSGRAPRVIRVDMDGLRSTIDTFASGSRYVAGDVAVGPMGEVYVARTALYRLAPAGPRVLLARLPRGEIEQVAAEADGSLLVTSVGDGLRVLRWRAGALGLLAPLGTLGNVAAGPAGAALVSDAEGRVMEIARDGAVRRVAGRTPTWEERFTSRAIAARADGAIVQADGRVIFVIDRAGRRRAIAGGTTKRLTNEGDGLPARQAALDAQDVAVAPDGSVVFVDGHRVRFIAPRVPRRLGVALLVGQGRATAGRYRARFASTLPSAALVDVYRVSRTGYTYVGEHAQHARASARNRITVHAGRRPGLYELDLSASTGSGKIATQATTLFLGGRLPVAWGRALAAPALHDGLSATTADEPDDVGPDVTWRVGVCGAVATRRVDCRVERSSTASEGRFSCDHIVSVVLRPRRDRPAAVALRPPLSAASSVDGVGAAGRPVGVCPVVGLASRTAVIAGHLDLL